MNPPPANPETSNSKLALGLLLGWLVPGLGHVVYRRVDKAIYFGVLVLLAFGVGLALGEYRVINVEKFGLYLAAQLWNGLPSLATLFVTKDLRITHDIAGLDVGLLFTSVAGLLNIVVLVDLYEIHLKIRDPAGAAQAAGATRS